MRSALIFLFLPLQLANTLDLNDVNERALGNETKTAEEAHKLDCIKDIGVSPLASLRSVKPYYQIFILDLTTPMETFARIRLLFVQAVCLYAAASNHIRIGYIALVNKHKVSSEPSIPDIREFIGMWTEPDEKLLNGVAEARQETPLTHCEKADLLGHIINRFKKMTAKPFRFLIIDDQKKDDQTNIDCDQAYEFGKALWRRNISLDNFILDEVIAREQDHSSGRRMSKAPIFTLGSLDDTGAFMKGMKAYIEGLQKPESWSSAGLKSMIAQNEMVLDDEPEDGDDPVVIEFPHAASNFTLHSEENMTNPGFFDDDEEEIGVKKSAAVGDLGNSSSPLVAAAVPPTAAPAATAADLSTTTPVPVTTTTTTNSNTTDAAAAAAASDSGLDWPYILLIVVVALILAFILFVLFCCWYDKRKLKTKLDKGLSNTSLATTPSNHLTTPLLGVSSKQKTQETSGSSSKRPLRLTKSNHVADTPDGAPIVEKNLPDPYSPVKYMNTPVPMPSEIEMTHTEHITPPTMDEALNKHVVTPMEKVPELHIDDYNL